METRLMPMKPLKPCKHSECPKLTEYNCCNEHKKIHIKDRLILSRLNFLKP